MKFMLDLDMPATVKQMEEFCTQVRRVHEGHPKNISGQDDCCIDDVLIKTQSESDEHPDTGGTMVTVFIEREL